MFPEVDRLPLNYALNCFSMLAICACEMLFAMKSSKCVSVRGLVNGNVRTKEGVESIFELFIKLWECKLLNYMIIDRY